MGRARRTRTVGIGRRSSNLSRLGAAPCGRRRPVGGLTARKRARYPASVPGVPTAWQRTELESLTSVLRGVCVVSELEWMEREERYKTGVVRTLILISVIVTVFFGAGFWVLHRQQVATQKAEAEAEEAALLAEAARVRAEFAADSSAAANRLADFRHNYEVEDLEGAPVYLVPLPRNKSVQRFIAQVWADYMRVFDPEMSDEQIRNQFELHYINVMNNAVYNSRGAIVWDGEMRPTAVILPSMKQRGRDLEFEKPSFAQIIRGQESAGIRILEEEELFEEPIGADAAMSQNVPAGADRPDPTAETSAPQAPGSEEPAPQPEPSP